MPEWRSTALKRLKETYKSDDVVIPGLQRHVMKQMAKEDLERSPHVIHPSDMVKPEWCGRHDYYRITKTRYDRKAVNNPSFNMANAFAEGHTIHEKYQTWLWEMGVLYGKWLCQRCNHVWTDLSPKTCPKCESPWLHYKEVSLERKPYLINGHADGAVHDLDGWTGLIEVKSIGIGTIRFEAPRMHQRYLDGNETLDEMWWKINRPFPSHMKQGQLYLWLSWPRYNQIVFIYESKFHQKQKEFLVSYNPKLIAPLIDQAKDVSQGVRAKIPPERPVWAVDMQVKTCRSCTYRNICWSIDAVEETAPKEAKVRVKRADSRKRRAALSQT